MVLHCSLTFSDRTRPHRFCFHCSCLGENSERFGYLRTCVAPGSDRHRSHARRISAAARSRGTLKHTRPAALGISGSPIFVRHRTCQGFAQVPSRKLDSQVPRLASNSGAKHSLWSMAGNPGMASEPSARRLLESFSERSKIAQQLGRLVRRWQSSPPQLRRRWPPRRYHARHRF